MTNGTYCIDASALIHASDEAYPLDVFGSFWSKLDELIDQERVVAPREVLKEIAAQSDPLHKWCKQRNGMFLAPEPEIQVEMKAVTAQFPSLVDLRKGRGVADPWVVAVGRVRKCIVVTQERPKPSKPRIPDACSRLGVDCMNLLGLIRRERWNWN